jgi:hypothetical protein
MELEIYTAFTQAGVADGTARAAVDSIRKEIDNRYALHSAQLATKGDLAEMQTRLLRAMADMQRWTLTALFGGLAALAVIVKLWS